MRRDGVQVLYKGSTRPGPIRLLAGGRCDVHGAGARGEHSVRPRGAARVRAQRTHGRAHQGPAKCCPVPVGGEGPSCSGSCTRVQVLPLLCIDGEVGALIIQGLPETEALLKAMKSQIVLDITSVVTKYYEATHGGDVYIRPYANEPAGVVVSIDDKLVIVLFQLSIGSALAAPHVRSQPTLLAHSSYVMAAVAEGVKALLRPDRSAARAGGRHSARRRERSESTTRAHVKSEVLSNPPCSMRPLCSLLYSPSPSL